ncbi:hypothetical protein [Neobacillus sp. D3-1R]|uniref:hypothetical protein n=1 Tax=Neobacillus sp. D3-1R TaxID=3445778 RepID=UPI003FA147BD
MLNPAWLFVIASIIAVIGILFSFKIMMSQIQTIIQDQGLNMEMIQKEQTRFFIKIAISEAVPILLIVYGFTLIGELEEPVNILFPIVIIVGVFLFALVQILLTRRDVLGFHDVNSETKTFLNAMIFIGVAMVAAIPIVSVVALLTIIE